MPPTNLTPAPDFPTLLPRASNGGSNNTRSPTDIAWSSLAVIFASTWIAIHPNVPPPKIRSSAWKLWKRRVFLMFWALLVPEFMIQWAVKQWFDALDISRRQQQAVKYVVMDKQQKKMDFFSDIVLGKESARRECSGHVEKSTTAEGDRDPANSNDLRWSKSQCYFFAMGGFTLHQDGKEVRPLRMDDMLTTSPAASPSSSGFLSSNTLISSQANRLIPWPDRLHAEIDDKSKGDCLAKTLVILQTTWYLIQLLARAILHLVVTELEIVALAYAVLCGLLYLFWWNKPLDAQEPIKVTPPPTFPTSSPSSSSSPGYGHQKPQLHQQQREPEGWYDFLIMILCGDFIFRLHGKIIEEPADDYAELATDAIEGTLSRRKKVSLAVSGLAATVFGGIHCIPWNFTFPSATEQWIWKVCSVLVTAVPLGWTISLYVLWTLDQAKNAARSDFVIRSIRYFAIYPTLFLLSLMLYSYFVARAILLVEAFTLLRSLSPSATQSVQWALFIPHI